MELSECCREYIINDERTGDEICYECGRANRSLLSPFHYSEENELSEHIVVKELRDICANGNISEYLTQEAVNLLKKEKIKTRIIAAQTLHKVFQNHHVPRTYKELSNLFYISPSQIGKYTCVSETKPSHLAERVLADLNITRLSLVEKIAATADELFEGELNSVSPQSALAVSIALHHENLPMKQVAKSCHITKQTLQKHYKKISALFVERK